MITGMTHPQLNTTTHGFTSVICLLFFCDDFQFSFLPSREGMVGFLVLLFLLSLFRTVTLVRTSLALVTAQSEQGLFFFMFSSAVPPPELDIFTSLCSLTHTKTFYYSHHSLHTSTLLLCVLKSFSIFSHSLCPNLLPGLTFSLPSVLHFPFVFPCSLRPPSHRW